MDKNKKQILLGGGVIILLVAIIVTAISVTQIEGLLKGMLSSDSVDEALVDESRTVTEEVVKEEVPAEPEIDLKPKTDEEEEQATEEKVILPAANVPKEDDSRTSTDETLTYTYAGAPVVFPYITPLNSLATDTTTTDYYHEWGTTSAYDPILAFKLTPYNNDPKLAANTISLSSLDFDYKYCFGGNPLNPFDPLPLLTQTEALPKLYLNYLNEQALVAIDNNLDGTFDSSEFIQKVQFDLPAGETELEKLAKEFAITMLPRPDLCQTGSKGRVVLKDILWSDGDKNAIQYSNTLLDNPILEEDLTDGNLYTVQYL